MSAPALLREPYRRRPVQPLDLSWVPRSGPSVGAVEQEAAAREALVRLGAADLIEMLLGPIKSPGQRSRAQVVS